MEMDLVGALRAAKVHAVSLAYGLTSAELVDECHEAGIAVVLAEMWKPDFEHALELGVDVVGWGEPIQARRGLGCL